MEEINKTTKKTRHKYTSEFKAQAVAHVHRHGGDAASVRKPHKAATMVRLRPIDWQGESKQPAVAMKFGSRT